jgi:hypothetical protein
MLKEVAVAYITVLSNYFLGRNEEIDHIAKMAEI